MSKIELMPALYFLLKKKRHNLTVRQLAVFFECREGPQTVRGMSDKLGITKPAVCRAADKLCEINFLSREPDPDSRRSVLLVIQKEGREFARSFA